MVKRNNNCDRLVSFSEYQCMCHRKLVDDFALKGFWLSGNIKKQVSRRKVSRAHIQGTNDILINDSDAIDLLIRVHDDVMMRVMTKDVAKSRQQTHDQHLRYFISMTQVTDYDSTHRRRSCGRCFMSRMTYNVLSTTTNPTITITTLCLNKKFTVFLFLW